MRSAESIPVAHAPSAAVALDEARGVWSCSQSTEPWLYDTWKQILDPALPGSRLSMWKRHVGPNRPPFRHKLTPSNCSGLVQPAHQLPQ